MSEHLDGMIACLSDPHSASGCSQYVVADFAIRCGKELDRLRAENQRLREATDTSLPLCGTVENGKVTWSGIDAPPDSE